jgi:hypothetical protein
MFLSPESGEQKPEENQPQNEIENAHDIGSTLNLQGFHGDFLKLNRTVVAPKKLPAVPGKLCAGIRAVIGDVCVRRLCD